ncbi:MAG: acyl-CoA carboxylase subunit epsilon [Streptomycetaceae bacterium]|nr:acyl-CoA carboxylase subunit epsilon [Streptomycetaceae bacterium]
MSNDTVVRVERGTAGPEELAAITAILLARAAVGERSATSCTQRRSLAGWRRLERQSGFRAPHSWQG